MTHVPVNDNQKQIVVDIDDDGDDVSDVSDKFERSLTIRNLPPPPPTTRKSSSVLELDEGPIHTALARPLKAASSTRKGGRRIQSDQSDQGAATTSTTTSSSPVSQKALALVVAPVGEHELEQLIHEAEYEIHQDPYRGILSHRQSLETQTKITTPWHACELGSLHPEPLERIEDLDDPQIVVRNVGNCACPSLKAWTRNLRTGHAKKKEKNLSKKRRRAGSTTGSPEVLVPSTFQVGVRPRGDTFVCPCDFNPLCLATLGGIVNQLIEERCRDLDPFVHHDSNEAKSPPASGATPSPASISQYFNKRNTNHVGGNFSECNDAYPVKGAQAVSSKKPVLDKTNSHRSTHPKILDVDKGDEHSIVVDSPMVDNDDDESSDPFTIVEKCIVASPTMSSSRPPSRRKTPLLEPLYDVPPGNPMDVFLQAQVSQQDVNCIEFSSHTNEALKRCRSSVQVETASIRTYVHQKLKIPLSEGDGDDGDRITVDKYMKILKEWHSQMLFVNPIMGGQSSASDKIALSMPPGIRNLGATCYLNSQLQCLAQNVTFLNGIFSWRVVDETHRMNSVMTKLQLLLAQMFLGGESKLTTLEFSNALGLEHYEQQDPNEFARLLFDRMDESFQQCDNDGDLSNLLNRIFHGVSTYETVCLKCGKKSERNEGFMDLNLPIVKPPKEPKKKSGTIEEAFASASSKDVDTTVQFCLDEYTCTEMLDGENQYFCSECDEKQDAKRILKLTELPPVLNVQLSRYVYDRTKFTKKKVCDKVLLPTSLDVTTGGSVKKYLLCAVMRHQGNSAYSGHYLAEAMDWISGQWFEFNDEIVKLLPEGPSSSFDPEDTSRRSLSDVKSGVEKGKGPPIRGSQDAYNMYYVDEGYLSKAAQADITWRQEICRKGPNAGEVLDDVTDLRNEQFKELSKLYLDDAKGSDRLHRRKLGIRNYLVPSIRSLVPTDASSDRFVWVSTKFLRKYLKCEPDNDLDSLLESRDPVIQNVDLLCPHGDGLTPRVAHNGKLLSLKMYDTLVCLLKGERALLRGVLEGAAAGDEAEIEDYMIGPNMHMICEECSATHRDSLLTKVCQIRSAKALFVALDPAVGDVELQYDGSEVPESLEDRFVYAISRQSAVKFRRKVTLLIKSLAKSAGGGESDTKSPTGTVAFCEGLWAVNMSSIECDNDDDFNELKNFNESITCSHGNLLPTSGRQVQCISGEVWQMIKQLFPASVEHKIERTLKGSPDSANYDCRLCIAERDSVEELRDSINRWAKEVKRDGHDLAKTGLNLSNGCRLMHRSDAFAWREAVKVLSNLKRIKGGSVDAIRDFVESLIFPSRHAIVFEFETAPIDKFGASLRSFICREHHRVVKDAILASPFICNGEGTRTLASYITAVSNVEYHAYLDSLASMLWILSPDRSSTSHEVGSPVGGVETKILVESLRTIAMSHHPSIQLRQSSDNDPNSYLQLSVDGSIKEFTLSPSLCLCESCSKEYLPVLLTNKENGKDRTEGIDDLTGSKSTGNTKRGSGATDPILVESDMDDDLNNGKYHLRVFQAKEGSSEEETFKSLREVSVIAFDPDEGSEIRRSSRKRKQIYPVGVLLSEETIDACVNYNIAAICLLMFQSGIQIDFSKLLVVVHQPFEKPKMFQTTTSTKDLALTIPQIIGENETDVDITKHVTLLYERQNDRPDANATCINDDLFHYSNIHDEAGGTTKGDGSSTKPKEKKNRPSERGFQGTLLQGFQPVAASASDGADKESEDEADMIQGCPGKPDDHGGKDRDESLNQGIPSVVLEDSSVSSTRTLSPSTPKREVSSDDDNTEDERILKMGPTFGPSPQKNRNFNYEVGHLIDMSTSTVNDRDDGILGKLIAALGEAVGTKDTEQVGLAATMVLSSHPQATENDFDELLASALGSYFANT